ncbi:MAG TPA: hypothetical protein VK133_01100 [Amoebophilaceae bacterium]|nr:hypothetical protein [Amoebophilaceae bacterium]
MPEGSKQPQIEALDAFKLPFKGFFKRLKESIVTEATIIGIDVI